MKQITGNSKGDYSHGSSDHSEGHMKEYAHESLRIKSQDSSLFLFLCGSIHRDKAKGSDNGGRIILILFS